MAGLGQGVDPSAGARARGRGAACTPVFVGEGKGRKSGALMLARGSEKQEVKTSTERVVLPKVNMADGAGNVE